MQAAWIGEGVRRRRSEQVLTSDGCRPSVLKLAAGGATAAAAGGGGAEPESDELLVLAELLPADMVQW